MCRNLIRRKISFSEFALSPLKPFGHVGSVLIFNDLDTVSIDLNNYQTFFFILVLRDSTYIKKLLGNLLDSCRFLLLIYKSPVKRAPAVLQLDNLRYFREECDLLKWPWCEWCCLENWREKRSLKPWKNKIPPRHNKFQTWLQGSHQNSVYGLTAIHRTKYFRAVVGEGSCTDFREVLGRKQIIWPIIGNQASHTCFEPRLSCSRWNGLPLKCLSLISLFFLTFSYTRTNIKKTERCKCHFYTERKVFITKSC